MASVFTSGPSELSLASLVGSVVPLVGSAVSLVVVVCDDDDGAPLVAVACGEDALAGTDGEGASRT